MVLFATVDQRLELTIEGPPRNRDKVVAFTAKLLTNLGRGRELAGPGQFECTLNRRRVVIHGAKHTVFSNGVAKRFINRQF